jgi:hypothetical protein
VRRGAVPCSVGDMSRGATVERVGTKPNQGLGVHVHLCLSLGLGATIRAKK